MNEIGQSIAEAIRKRAVSSALGSYLFFWCAIHWEGIYVTLFTNQDLIYGKYGMLKNEYVRLYFFGWKGWETFMGFLAPILLTALFIWIIPKYVLIHAYRQEQRHKVDKRRIRYEEEGQLEEARKDLAVQQKQAVEAEVGASRAIKDASRSDPTIIWQREMNDFLKIEKSTQTLIALKEVVYKDNGHLTDYSTKGGDWMTVRGMSADELALAHTNDLITLDKRDETVELTEKGKFFVSRLNAAYQPV